MQRAQLIAIGCLALLIACTSSSTDAATTTTSATVAPTAPTTTTTIALAPTDCREAPQLPACRPGHGIDRSLNEVHEDAE